MSIPGIARAPARVADPAPAVVSDVAHTLLRGFETARGEGRAPAHYGELFQGRLPIGPGRYRRCLVSLPCYVLQSRATFVLDQQPDLEVDPPHKQKAKTAARLALERLGAANAGGRLRIDSTVVEGKGSGSSTTDCIAAVRAVGHAFGVRLHELTVAELVVRAERASDSTMFDRAVLFGGRDAVIVEDYGRRLPRLVVAGIDTDESSLVDTLVHPSAEYDASEHQAFVMLAGALRRAIRTDDTALLGRIATASATINQRFLPKACFAELLGIARRFGALGVAVAHSGTLASILLDPRDAALGRSLEQVVSALERLALGRPIVFTTEQQRPWSAHELRDHVRGLR
jgi:uncharacterized protein involved in propanediol utilization